MIPANPLPVAPAPGPNWYSYLDYPSGPSRCDVDDKSYEVVNGTRVEKVMGAREVDFATRLYDELAPWVRENRAGRTFPEMPYVLPSSGNERKPDVSFMSFGTWAENRRIPPGRGVPAAPDLAVEVISPNDLAVAVFAKVAEYFAEGVKAVWVAILNVEQVYCYTTPTAVRILSRGDELTGEPVLPGFRLALADLFPPPDEPAA